MRKRFYKAKWELSKAGRIRLFPLFSSGLLSNKLKSQNTAVDENNEDVDVDEIETDQVRRRVSVGNFTL